MSDEIEVHFDEKRSHLRLTCGADAFLRVRKAIAGEPGLAEIAPVDRALRIEVESVAAGVQISSRMGMHLAPAILIAICFAAVVGVVTIVQWVVQRVA